MRDSYKKLCDEYSQKVKYPEYGEWCKESIDTISYDKNYEKAVKDFETKHPDYIVYHAIESITAHGKLLSLLYVSNDKEDWESERLESDNNIMSYVVNIDNPDLSEFGYIAIDGFMGSGALVRTDAI